MTSFVAPGAAHAQETATPEKPPETTKTGSDDSSPSTTKGEEGEDEPVREPSLPTQKLTITTGVTSIAPYTIKATKNATDLGGAAVPTNADIFYLDDSDDVDVLGFVELRFRNRLAWSRPDLEEERLRTDWGWSFSCGYAPKAAGGEKPGRRKLLSTQVADRFFNGQCMAPSDLDLHIGFTFGQGSEVNGSAIAGSGDLNVLLDAGWPIAHRDTQLGELILSETFGVESGLEIVTERAVQDVHDRYWVGLGYAIGIHAPPLKLPGSTAEITKKDWRTYEFSIRGGYNWLEEPNKYTNGKDVCVPDCTSGDRVVRIRGDSDPKFLTESVFGMDLDLQLPIGKTAYLILNSGVYDGDPNPWFVRLGVTVPIGGILGIFNDFAL